MREAMMERVAEPTPLGALLRKHREARRVSWKRLSAVVLLEDETMMLWERGVTRDPPIHKTLLFAQEVGIPLQLLAQTVLGKPYAPLGSTAAEAENVEMYAGLISAAQRMFSPRSSDRDRQLAQEEFDLAVEWLHLTGAEAAQIVEPILREAESVADEADEERDDEQGEDDAPPSRSD